MREIDLISALGLPSGCCRAQVANAGCEVFGSGPFSAGWCVFESRVQGSGVRAQGSGLRVQDAGFRVQDAGFRIQGTGFRAQGAGFKIKENLGDSEEVGCRVCRLWFRI